MEKQAKEEDSRVSVWLWRGMSCSVELVVPVALPYHGRPNCSLRPSRGVEPKTIGSWGKTLQWIPYHVRNSSSPQPYGRRFVVVCLLALPFGDAPNQIADFLAQSLISASSIPGLADHRRIRYRRFILQFGCLGTTKCVELRFDLVIVPLYIKAGYFSSCLGICLGICFSKDSSVFNGPVSPNSPLSPSGPVSPNKSTKPQQLRKPQQTQTSIPLGHPL